MSGLTQEVTVKEKLTALNFNMKSAFKVLRPLYQNELNGFTKPFYLSAVSKESRVTQSQITRYREIGLVRFEKQRRNTMVYLTEYGRAVIKAFMLFVGDKAVADETTKV